MAPSSCRLGGSSALFLLRAPGLLFCPDWSLLFLAYGCPVFLSKISLNITFPVNTILQPSALPILEFDLLTAFTMGSQHFPTSPLQHLFPNKYLAVVYVFFSSIEVCELKSRDCVIHLIIPAVLSTMPGT